MIQERKNVPISLFAAMISSTRGGFRGGSGKDGWWGSVDTPFDSKLQHHGKFWINLINLGYRIYPKYSHL